MKDFGFRHALKFIPPLDSDYRPIVMENFAYKKTLENAQKEPVKIAIERENGLISVYNTEIFRWQNYDDNKVYIERLIKTLLWLKGGWKITVGGPEYIGKYIKESYAMDGQREFDVIWMKKVYNKEIEVVVTKVDRVPVKNESPKKVGGNLDGNRIGFDAGGSDRKVSAVVNGNSIYSEEVVWHPKLSEDPQYQYDGILDSMKTAASKMDSVDAIGVSAAGIYIDNEVKAASLFMRVPDDLFEKKVRNMFLDLSSAMGDVPIEVTNDGDVTALAGAMSLGENRILGIAMGTSEAAGYVDENGFITGWLNELAFCPVDYSINAMQDEWSIDYGVGCKYFSQDSVIKLAKNGGIKLDDTLSPAEKLKVVQHLMKDGDETAKKIYVSIGYYLGYSLAYYAEFYDINHVLLLGRVTSGQGGDIIVEKAKDVLKEEFPMLKIKLSMPDEKARRVGQSVAAASLPKI